MIRLNMPSVSLIAVMCAACAPQSADLVSGSYTAFLAVSTSSSLLKDEVDPEDFDNRWQYDCRAFCAGADDTPDALCKFASKDEETLLHLPESIVDEAACVSLMNINSPTEPLPVARDPEASYPSIYPGDPYAIENWLFDDGYNVVQEELDPWRGEAIVTSEGDLQIGFHHRLPGGADFRFDFTVNPEFQPITCLDVTGPEGVPDGETEPVAVDGNWLDQWSLNLTEALAAAEGDPRYDVLRKYEGGRLFYVNSFGYQFNPEDPQSYDNGLWYLPNEWLTGMSFGKFAEEYVSHRTVRFGEPLMYGSFEATDDQGADPVVDDTNVWYCDLPEGANPLGSLQNGDPITNLADVTATTAVPGCTPLGTGYDWHTMPQLLDRAGVVRDEALAEYASIEAAGGPSIPMALLLEDNAWRRPDGHSPGLDGWAELHYNWIVLSADSDPTVGGHVSGAFQLTLDGVTSTSRVIVSGEFESEHIRRDKWTSKNLQEEQDVPVCGSADLIAE